MKKIILQRFSRANVTYGVLMLDWQIGHKPIYTLELPWRENKTNISCVPQGVYDLSPYSSPKYPNVFQVDEVHGRSYILVHIGNYTKDTHGCILIGLGIAEAQQMVTNSRPAMSYLHDMIGSENQESLKLEIKN